MFSASALIASVLPSALFFFARSHALSLLAASSNDPTWPISVELVGPSDLLGFSVAYILFALLAVGLFLLVFSYFRDKDIPLARAGLDVLVGAGVGFLLLILLSSVGPSVRDSFAKSGLVEGVSFSGDRGTHAVLNARCGAFTSVDFMLPGDGVVRQGRVVIDCSEGSAERALLYPLDGRPSPVPSTTPTPTP